jgi:hypothetical protein
MRLRKKRGVSTIEFAFSLMVLVPLLLGTGAIGVNLIRTLATIQLARDAGHMYARGTDFSQLAGRNLLARLGSNLNLSATTGAGSGGAVVILSALTFVDVNACAAVGAVYNGVPTGDCTNLNKWVFTQRLEIGNTTLRASNFGSPLTSGPNGVTLDAQGKITMNDYVKKSGAVANFTNANGVHPLQVVNGQVSGLPSGQQLYLSEAGAKGFGVPPYAGGNPTYSFAFF